MHSWRPARGKVGVVVAIETARSGNEGVRYRPVWLQWSGFLTQVCVSASTAERARVGLTTLPGMKGTDYINASYIMVQPLQRRLCHLYTGCPNARHTPWKCLLFCLLRVITGVMSSSLPSILCPTPPLIFGGWSGTIMHKLLSCCLTTRAW